MLAALAALSLTAMAQDRGARPDDADFVGDYTPPPVNRLWYSNATFVRVNPLGLVNSHRVGWRRRLSDKRGVLFQDTYGFLGGTAIVTPAYARVGVAAEAQVLAVLRVFGDISTVQYFGTFDQLMTWDDPGSRYSDQSIAARSGDSAPGGGWVVTFGGTARAKVGPIAVRSTLQFTRFSLGVGDDLFFYDQFWDRLAPNNGFMVLNDADVLYVKDALRLGVRHTYSDTLDARVDGEDAGLAHHRVGPLFAWQFKDHPPGRKVNQPTLFVLAQWWLQHPYRTGDEQPGAMPLFAVGFAFNGDYKTSALP